MNKVEIYKAMRLWENITSIVKDRTKEIKKYQNGEKTFSRDLSDPFTTYETAMDTESKVAQLIDENKAGELEKQEIEISLQKEGIDVEYIVTNVYTDLKKGVWLHNYYIQQNKILNGGYEYKTFEHSEDKENERMTYPTLKEAVVEILSYYRYLPDLETVDEALEKLKTVFTSSDEIQEGIKIKNLPVGTEITFAGKQWIVLNPETGYVFMKDELPTSRAFDTNDKQNFNPNDSNNIAYYLNTTYYNTLKTEEKAFIQSHDWGIGSLSLLEVINNMHTLTLTQMKAKEDTSKVTANIGLLSVSEWRTYSNLGFLDAPFSRMWTRTPFADHSSYVWYVFTTSYESCTDASLSGGVVRPALYLDSDLGVYNDVMGMYVCNFKQ